MSSNAIKDMANAIRFLAVDAVQRAGSGHPGMPMGMADVATILFKNHLRFNPEDPKWLNRDRFVLSAGHGSMLLYALLYLTGYKDVTINDIKNFRQLKSKLAGHPEYGHLDGIETTTGPLGQGVANAVGMALAGKIMAANFGDDIFNNKIYCIAGDGCLMEGISYESCSLAAHLNLSNLILIWDNNNISIDGEVSLANSENTAQRFANLGFLVIEIDGHNYDEIEDAFNKAKKSDKPVFISCKTIIAFGSPNKSASNDAHGMPLGEKEIELTRKKLGWQHKDFDVSRNILLEWRSVWQRNEKEYKNWQAAYGNLSEEKRADLERRLAVELPDGLIKKIENCKKNIFFEKPVQPTRKSSGYALELLTEMMPELIAGSADLTGSVNTKTKAVEKVINKNDFSGRYIHYGVREHGMAGIMNGMALYGGIIPYAGTFLVFSDYMRPAIRLAAMMKLPVIYVFTHDSIGIGEDGPTHQPVEHLASLRAMPNLYVFRPADAHETMACYEIILQHKTYPAAVVLTRQSVPFLRTEYNKESLCAHGAYIISDSAIYPDIIIMATGSELSLALQTKDELHKFGVAVRVISVVCFKLFEKQEQSYKNALFECDKKTLFVAIEAGVDQCWRKYIGTDGLFFGVDSFGYSAPYEEVYKKFNLVPDIMAKKIKKAWDVKRAKIREEERMLEK